jgi:uncharacterized membrane protein YdjX (TVP38/TMEM64 family)
MQAKRRNSWIISVGIFVALVAVTLVVLSPLQKLLSSPEVLREKVASLGVWAPAISVVLEVSQVIIAPVPGQAIDFANGYLFGWLVGSLCSLLGIGIGTAIAISLARRFGRPLVEKLITPKGMQQIQPYTRRRSHWLFFFLFLLPGTPDDLLCFAIGLTSIPLPQAMAIALLGRTPGIVAAVLTGATGQSLNVWEFSLIAAGVSLLLILIAWKTPLKAAMNIPDVKLKAGKK